MGDGSTHTLTRRQWLAGTGAALIGASVYGDVSNVMDSVQTRLEAHALEAHARMPLRVALMTDMHGPHNWIHQTHLVREIAQFRPHLVCIVGDAVDTRGDEHLVSRYDAMHGSLGTFATLGNWEHESRCDLDLLRKNYEHAGVRLLVNETARIDLGGEPIDIVGLDDWRAGRPHYDLITNLTPGGATAPRALVLSHCPITFDTTSVAAPRPTITLAGHTHGGQIAPFGIALVTPEGSGTYVRGWYHTPDQTHHLYVSRGLGHSTLPFRLGARPELTLLTV